MTNFNVQACEEPSSRDLFYSHLKPTGTRNAGGKCCRLALFSFHITGYQSVLFCEAEPADFFQGYGFINRL